MLAPIVEIFCEIDDFCKQFFHQQKTKVLPDPNRQRQIECRMSVSEIMTIVILLPLFRNFSYQGVESLRPLLIN